ncbi:hypothetical protein TTHERM_00069600 (macronuclear) [Tetrahymena thermophila SB210]|uniref:Transmembrane protein n=1 Tax=Tetrahymena thermophila (strain SB210) TaxID=312017 RepID=I7LTZ0_TETTS|nr:hypothetical protein TTHERM_00069600 [Tetrahymena thermophila SB210]EAR87553.1 hypothetical protein TTHERM_00069600 [Tetrahymena thermophila SB210]|eukprot:XP_001007798.1 hypothetical protein TTHERM_00069600 [Tetrahymena thermophila SB210]
MQKYLLLALIVVVCQCQQAQQPLPPVWPNRFSQDFVETWNITNTIHRSVGTYFYDYTQGTTRLARSNGQYDPLCKSLHTDAQQCDQIIVNGERYIYYPDTQECCYCCGQNDGCGVLSPQWFIEPTFLGNVSYYGVPAYKWVIYEGPNEANPNYYIETTEEEPTQRQLLYLARSNYEQNYFLDSLRTDFGSIDLPQTCNRKSLCPGTCAKVRPAQSN